jgi:hypothetical protein
MHDDIERNGRKYRIIVEPMGARSPAGPRGAVYQFEGDRLAPTPLKEKLGGPGETKQAVETWARNEVAVHADFSNPPTLKLRCPTSGLLYDAGMRPPTSTTPDQVWGQNLELPCPACGGKHRGFLG